MESKKSILIIDDTYTNIELFHAIIGDQYEILFATKGLEGYEAALRHLPELILLDVMMPDLDGYEVCRRLKKHPSTKAIPVIFISVLDHEEDEEKGLEAGAIDYIAKPFNVTSIKAKIRNHILFKDMLTKAEYRIQK